VVDYARSVPAAPNVNEIVVALPEQGPGSLAPAGRRILGFLADVILSALVAAVFTAPHLPRNTSLVVFGIEYLVFSTLAGQTPGMFLARLRIIRVDRPARLGPLRALVRTVLLMLLIPALIWDRNGRGLHDRLSQSAVVRA
jgi:uncharacterized RDD family membrane protein YckC